MARLPWPFLLGHHLATVDLVIAKLGLVRRVNAILIALAIVLRVRHAVAVVHPVTVHVALTAFYLGTILGLATLARPAFCVAEYRSQRERRDGDTQDSCLKFHDLPPSWCTSLQRRCLPLVDDSGIGTSPY